MGMIFVCVKRDNQVLSTRTYSEFEKDYKIGSILGIGQFSEVKEADSIINGKVAIKCINIAQMKSDKHLLKREIDIMKKISHPNIVKLYEIYQNAENIYITMEICSNGSLKEKITMDGPMPASQVKELARSLLDALAYLHKNRICHRDLKPENILFRENVAKIADFGLARLMEGTNKFTIVGTPYYLSPEVISGDYNNKCDIWSLGVVLYFALTNRLPFYGEGYDDLFNRISCTDIDWYGINEEEEAFLRYIMAKDYKIRPTAEDALKHSWLKN